MKVLVPLVLAALVAVLVIVRPAAPPARATAWVVATPPAPPGRRRPDAAGALVYVAGAVVHPGVYRVDDEARVRDALAKAGGVRGDGDVVAVNPAAHVRDGDEIVVPLRGAVDGVAPRRSRGRPGRHRRRRAPSGAGYRADAGDAGYRADAGDAGYRAGDEDYRPPHKHRGRSAHRNAAPPSAPIDLNSAGSDLLSSVPGIGPGLALRIVAFRDANGPFASPDELLDVAGITDRRLDAILPYVIAR